MVFKTLQIRLVAFLFVYNFLKNYFKLINLNWIAAKENSCPGSAPLFFVPVKLCDAPLWLVAGGVRREGDVGEEQRHFQRRHPEPAEGEQVGCSISNFSTFLSTLVIYIIKEPLIM